MRYFTPFLLLLLLVALLLRIEFIFTIFYLLVAIRAFATLWMRRAVRQLSGERRYVNRAFTGDRVEVRLTVRNGGWLPLLWVEIDELQPLNLRAAPFERRVFGLGSHDTWTTEYSLLCQRRGRYEIGPTILRTGDPLGLARHQLTLGGPEELIIYPRIVPLAQLGLPTRSPLATLPTSSPIFEDTSRLLSIRDYQRGDPPRRVHWRATARTGHLVVKQYQPAIARETMICLDLHDEGYPTARYRHDAVELAIVVAASLANHAIVRERLPVGLTTQPPARVPGTRATEDSEPANLRLPPRHERAHLIRILETLADVELVRGNAHPFAALLRRDWLDLPWGGTVVAITGHVDLALTEALLHLRRGGLAVALILVATTGAAAEPGWVAPPGVALYTIRSERDLEVLA
ncbi:MAG: DUF58 domain-containing protein [Thermomicrobiales bacterium]